MATYADRIASRQAILVSNFAKRASFLTIVKHSKTENVDTLPDNESTRALLACQALRLVLWERRCSCCGTAFRLCYKMRLYRWYGPHYDDACHECRVKEYSATSVGFLKHMKPDLWLPKLDCFIMWLQE